MKKFAKVRSNPPALKLLAVVEVSDQTGRCSGRTMFPYTIWVLVHCPERGYRSLAAVQPMALSGWRVAVRDPALGLPKAPLSLRVQIEGHRRPVRQCLLVRRRS